MKRKCKIGKRVATALSLMYDHWSPNIKGVMNIPVILPLGKVPMQPSNQDGRLDD